MNLHEKILELDKILEMLAGMTSNEMSRDLALKLQPEASLSRVQEEIDKTAEALSLATRFGTPPFYGFRNMCMALRRVKSGARLSLKELMDIAMVLRQIQALSDWYDHCAGLETELDYLFTQLTPVPYLLEKLERSIVSEDEIADAASAELAQIRRKISRAQQHLRDTLDKMVRSQDVQKCLQDTRVTLRDGRFVLPVKAEHRGQIQGLIHDSSASGQTLFIEPMSIVESNNDIRLLESQEQEEIERIIGALCDECAAWSDSIIRNHSVCAELNLYFAKANLAARMKAFPPVLSDDGVIDLIRARHPLIPADRVVPISFRLGDEHRALIITGPNTGGKTVALKTCGLLTLMAMCGLLIPAAEGSRISVFRHVFANIGDTQSIEQNLSTFSAHMKEVIHILEEADDSSLVLLDELGSGTDPVEGAALAEAIITRLKDNGAKLMVTTHYQELKLYATEQPDVENASCEFDVQTMRPTYRLIIGSPGKSNAFAITETLGLSKDVIEHAKSLVSVENSRFETAVEQLEQTRIALEAQLRQVWREKEAAAAHAKELAEEKEAFREEKIARMEQARLQANAIIETTKAESNALLDELEQLRKEKEKESFADAVTAAKAGSKQRFNKMYDNANPLDDIPQEQYTLPRPLMSGDTVLIADTRQKGVVVGNPDGSGQVFIQMGVMKTKVAVSRLRLVENQPQKPQNQKKQPGGKKQGRVSAKAERSGSMELDIRGRACDEGVYEMEAFLDRAVLSHISTVTIIHGKGTGLLRKAVHQRLKRLPYVKAFRLGVFGEGEDGVTIVTLK
ncbi:MAG: endonuclease MutS2 [Ruminococcus sp.]|nr:endonuclease MutS2 [Ruminococcus sp.]